MLLDAEPVADEAALLARWETQGGHLALDRHAGTNLPAHRTAPEAAVAATYAARPMPTAIIFGTQSIALPARARDDLGLLVPLLAALERERALARRRVGEARHTS